MELIHYINYLMQMHAVFGFKSLTVIRSNGVLGFFSFGVLNLSS